MEKVKKNVKKTAKKIKQHDTTDDSKDPSGFSGPNNSNGSNSSNSCNSSIELEIIEIEQQLGKLTGEKKFSAIVAQHSEIKTKIAQSRKKLESFETQLKSGEFLPENFKKTAESKSEETLDELFAKLKKMQKSFEELEFEKQLAEYKIMSELILTIQHKLQSAKMTVVDVSKDTEVPMKSDKSDDSSTISGNSD